MHRPVTRFRDKGLIGLLTAVSFLVIGPPATAQQVQQGAVSGAGGGRGFEYASEGALVNCPGQQLTGSFPGSRFQLNHVGTYDGVATGPAKVASYAGPTVVTINTGPYIINPEGTYTTCTLPGPVPIQGAVVKRGVGAPAGGNVDCPNLDGTFQRRGFDVVEFRLTGTCTVTGNVPSLTGTVQDQSTTHIITGVMHPCYAPLPFEDPEVPPGGCQLDPNASAILVTDYVVVPVALPNPHA